VIAGQSGVVVRTDQKVLLQTWLDPNDSTVVRAAVQFERDRSLAEVHQNLSRQWFHLGVIDTIDVVFRQPTSASFNIWPVGKMIGNKKAVARMASVGRTT
jgi:hypothetical protein